MKKLSIVIAAFGIGWFAPFAGADSSRIVNPDNGHEYQRFDSTRNWQQARAYCESLDGQLATITSAQENEFVDVFLATADVWIGGSDESVEGAWAWLTGEPWVYQKWAPGEPNNLYPEDYLMMYAYGLWNDARGVDPRSFVCEWPWAAFEDFEVTTAILDFNGGASADNAIVAGRFTLAAGSNGIDLLSEPVTMTAGPATITIPGDALSPVPLGYGWSGVVGGVEVTALFQDLGGDEFTFVVQARGTDLTGTSNPTRCQLVVGNDGGSQEMILKGRLGVGEGQLAIGAEASD